MDIILFGVTTFLWAVYHFAVQVKVVSYGSRVFIGKLALLLIAWACVFFIVHEIIETAKGRK